MAFCFLKIIGRRKELFLESVWLSVIQLWWPATASSNLFVGEQPCTGFVLLPQATVCIRSCALPTDAEAHLFSVTRALRYKPPCQHDEKPLFPSVVYGWQGLSGVGRRSPAIETASCAWDLPAAWLHIPHTELRLDTGNHRALLRSKSLLFNTRWNSFQVSLVETWNSKTVGLFYHCPAPSALRLSPLLHQTTNWHKQ